MTKKEQKLIDARIQRAVTGLQIPVMKMGNLSKYLTEMIVLGHSDVDLANAAKDWVNANT